MNARLGLVVRGTGHGHVLVLDCWSGQAAEYWDGEVAPLVLRGGVRVDREDIVLERAARAGLLAPARWTVLAEIARIDLHGGEQ